MSLDAISSRTPIPWTSDRTGADCEVYIGEGSNALEIAVTEQSDYPTKQFLERTWTDRRDGRPNPVLLVALHDDGTEATIFGPSGDEPPLRRGLNPDQVGRISDAALERPNRFAAQRFLRETFEQLDADLVGLRNQGLLATHELKVGVPDRSDWDTAADKAQPILDERGEDLVGELGYEIERLSPHSYVLKDAEQGRDSAVAVFLNEDESFDHAQDRFTGQTPVSYALNEAEDHRLEYVIATSGDTLRLYTTNPDAGFGSRGRTDTFIEANTNLLTEDNAGYLWLLFSAEALREDGTLEDIMERSKDYAASLGDRLRERIYDDVIPDLAESIAEARELEDPTRDELDETYRMALVMLYRLLFIAYAEDEGFLPRYNPRYERRSLKQTAHELHDIVTDEDADFDSHSATYWNEVTALVTAINEGRDAWGLPEYDGTLLSTEPDISETGALLAGIELTDDQFGPVLTRLLIDETPEGVQGPIDFRNIGVRDFGVIYEGLLESELSVADQPLTIDEEGRYIPVESRGQQTLGEDAEQAIVDEGEVYLHGLSGERKATGTYYTKTQFVEHLLDYSLEPAIDEHLERLDEMSDNAAAENFFDIRVADIAMGSGHFLVGAVDRIEARLSAYLTERSLPLVEQELDRLREAAEESFENEDEMPEVERSQLLRRQIARRCVYGVDLNPLATELARLSLWVHTFVPGLPLTFLDYNLVTGNSLAGIGTLEEVTELLDIEQTSLSMFAGGTDVMKDIRSDIDRIGQMADADASEVREARETRAKIESRLDQVRARFDILAASRIDEAIEAEKVSDSDIDDVTTLKVYEKAQKVLASTNPLHFPASFPEVFVDESGGFDVIVGNPPWEEATLEEDEFWTRYEPGLQREESHEGRKQEKIEELRKNRPDLVERLEKEQENQEKKRKILRNGPYPGMGQGDPDTYKAFYWRFWDLVEDRGYVGVLLPRTAFLAAGSEEFRRRLLNESQIYDVTFIKNNNNWAFEHVGPRYTITLLAFRKQEPEASTLVPIRGPFPNEQAYFEGIESGPFKFPVEEAKEWTGTASFPMLPANPESVEAFKKLSESPPLDSDEPDTWRARPYAELHETHDKTKDDGTQLIHQIENPPEDYWPVFDGGSINPPDKEFWKMDTGQRFGYADPDIMLEYLQESRENSYRYAGKRSPFYEMPEEWVYDENTLPCLTSRIAFRDVTQRTNQRTVLASLVPPEVFLTNKAPYFLWPRGDETDEAYLLGVLNSIPLDWYARRFVETNLNYYILNSFPIPRPGRNSILRNRVVEISGRLAAEDERYAEWADVVGVSCGQIEPEEQMPLINELDAVVAHLYNLSRKHLKVIFETFHDNWDYENRLNAVIDHYDEWTEKLSEQEHNTTDD